MSGVEADSFQGRMCVASAQVATTTTYLPHHPISCHEELGYDHEHFWCPHRKVPADDPRTVASLQHSMAILILEQVKEEPWKH